MSQSSPPACGEEGGEWVVLCCVWERMRYRSMPRSFDLATNRGVAATTGLMNSRSLVAAIGLTRNQSNGRGG